MPPKNKISFQHKKVIYRYSVKLSQEQESWITTIPALPGCNAWGDSKKDALDAIRQNAKIYIETLLEEKRPIPTEE